MYYTPEVLLTHTYCLEQGMYKGHVTHTVQNTLTGITPESCSGPPIRGNPAEAPQKFVNAGGILPLCFCGHGNGWEKTHAVGIAG